MATSDAIICNFALGHLGQSKFISNLETSRTSEATVCRLFFENTKEQTLRDFAYPISRAYEILGLVEENPTSEWAFSYRYPSKSLDAKRILSGIRNDTRQSRVPYLITSDDVGRLIFTDKEDACLEFTKNISVGLFTPDLDMAMAFLLASYIAPAVTGADPFKLGARAFQFYLLQVRKAKGAARNEEQDEEVPEAEQIRGRV